MLKLPASLCAVATAALALQTRHYYGLLPESVASHFALSGAANCFMSKKVFFAFWWAINALVLAYALWGVRLFPRRATKIPDRDYWLAPERREETLTACQTHAAWEGFFTLAFLFIVVELVARANLTGGGRLDNVNFIPVLVAFIAGILIFRRRFRRGFAAGTGSQGPR